MCDACLNINEQPTDKGLVINAVLHMDPTRTFTLRKKFVADMDKRFGELKKLITVSIVLNDCFGLKPRVTAPTPFFIQAAAKPGQFAFDRSSAKVEAFMAWLQEQEAAGVLTLVQKSRIGGGVEQPWTNLYIDTAYQRGIRRGRQELRNQGVDIPGFGDSQLRDPVMVAFNQPIHADRVGLIYTRTYSDLRGITAAMDTQISRVLGQGIAEGRGPRELARTINERVDAIGITRARTLARTEVIRAHHSANIQEYRNAGIEGVSVKAEWSTAGFNVCPICSALQGKVFTLDEIEGMIPRHPNCRCVCLPHLPGISKAPVTEAGPQYGDGIVPPVSFYDPIDPKVAALDFMQGTEAVAQKQLVANSLSSRMGLLAKENSASISILPEEQIQYAVQQWSISSNDHDLRSMWLQKQAAEEFGSSMSSWQIERFDKLMGDRARRVAAGVKNLPAKYQTIDENAFMGQEGMTKRFIRAQYDATQEYFKAANITHVDVYRGMQLDGAHPLAGAGKLGPVKLAEQNALESWSLEHNEALTFAQGAFPPLMEGGLPPGTVEVVIRMRVPVSRVLSTPSTGIGCLSEKELVLIGGKNDIAEIVHFRAWPKEK